jgi:hypothetical protein
MIAQPGISIFIYIHFQKTHRDKRVGIGFARILVIGNRNHIVNKFNNPKH